MKKIILFFATIILSFAGCVSDNSSGSASGTSVSPDKFTYTVASSGSIDVWTAPVSYIVSETDQPPSEEDSAIRIAAAKNEWEPFQLVINGSAELNIEFDGFSGLPSSSVASIYMAAFSNGKTLGLEEMSSGDPLTSSDSKATVIWIDLFIPKDAQSGTYNGTVVLKRADITIPVELTVFDFSLPDEIHFLTQLNASMSSLKKSSDAGDAENLKTMLYDHRLITKGGPLWPTSFSYSIVYTNSTFNDESTEGVYGIAHNASKFLSGTGWDRKGFSTAMAFQFVDNNTPRPDTFNGIPRGDHYGTSAYNNLWKQYLTDLNTYLVSNRYSDKVYYYVMNEPQDQADYDLAAYLCKMTKEAAPNLKIAVSEEPKAEIAEHSSYQTSDGTSYDIWIADIQHYKQDYAWERNRLYGEDVWFYHNDGTPDPFINPILFEKQGLHQRMLPWISWHYRARGWAYYNASIFFSNSIPNIRGKLLREGIEDYEYFYTANSSTQPKVSTAHAIDTAVDSAARSLTSFCLDDDALYDLKWRLGEYIQGTLADVPELVVEASRPAGNYYINFQETSGKPFDDPLIVDQNEYIKAGWSEYNTDKGYGWTGGCAGTSRAKYLYDDLSGYNELQKSVLYDDYGKVNLFEFDLASGTYTVTIGAGRAGRGCYDKHNITVEGISFLSEYESSEIVEISKEVTLSDGKLSVEIGDAVGQYTFLAYMNIEKK